MSKTSSNSEKTPKKRRKLKAFNIKLSNETFTFFPQKTTSDSVKVHWNPGAKVCW